MPGRRSLRGMWKRFTDTARRLSDRIAGVAGELSPALQNVAKPCTCGNPRKHGPCPRHGKLS